MRSAAPLLLMCLAACGASEPSAALSPTAPAAHSGADTSAEPTMTATNDGDQAREDAAATREPSQATRRRPRLARAPAAAPQPLRLPAPELPAAPWVEREHQAPYDPLSRRELRGIGRASALIATNAGTFVVDYDRGVLGPLDLPEGARWAALGPNDQILALTDQHLLVADDPGAALSASRFRQLTAAAGAVAFDAAGSTIAIADSDGAVTVSLDGGRRFRRAAALPGDGTIRQLLVRPDGTILVQRVATGDRKLETWLSRRGQRWHRSALQPTSLRRIGSWIISDGAACPAVLSRDGRRWVGDEGVANLTDDAALWTQMLEHSTGVVGIRRARYPTLTSPPVPRFDPEREIHDDGCRVLFGGSGGGGWGYGMLGGLGQRMEDPFGLVRGSPGRLPPATATVLHLLHDGACEPRNDEWGECAGEPLIRQPHAITVDRRVRTAAVHDLPSGCRPIATDNGRGLGLLFCRGARGTDVYTRAAHGWQRELRDAPDLGAWTLTAAADGTVALHPVCPPTGDCEVYVRLPVAPGGASAWRRIAAPGARAYRVAPGGAVVTLIDRGERRLSLLYDIPHGVPHPLAEDVELPPDTLISDFDLDDDTVGFRLRTLDDRTDRAYFLARTGRLVHVPGDDAPDAD